MLRDLTYELGRGFAYRTIKHSSMWMYTRMLPALFVFGSMLVYYFLPVPPPLLGKDALLASTMAVISTLPGFYFAGLAAVATFGNPTMDKEMPAPPPTIRMRIGGSPKEINLSRRLFLSYLFSYLVLMSFMLCAAILLLNMSAPSLFSLHDILAQRSWGGNVWQALKGVTIAGLSFCLGSLIVTTGHGMFFLMERIHQP